eukprot:1919855-Amphidinium_carterae.1
MTTAKHLGFKLATATTAESSTQQNKSYLSAVMQFDFIDIQWAHINLLRNWQLVAALSMADPIKRRRIVDLQRLYNNIFTLSCGCIIAVPCIDLLH